MKTTCASLTLVFLAACSSQTSTFDADFSSGFKFNRPDRQLVATDFRGSDPRALAVSDLPFAADVGADILRKGGNAIDASVAMGFALAVTAPQMTSLAGGGFILMNKGDRQVFYDFRERAPMRATKKMFENPPSGTKPSLDGYLAPGVPGMVAGLLLVHEENGRLPLEEVMAPAIRFAEQGFAIYPNILKSYERRKVLLNYYPTTREVFLPGGKIPKLGDVIVQKELAKTLKAIAKEGRKYFYEGPWAAALAKEMKRGGGIMTQKDLAAYEVLKRRPLTFPFRGYEVVSAPLPSASGIMLKQMLGMTELVNLKERPAQSVQSIHLLSEIMRRSFRDRYALLGDPHFVAVPAYVIRDNYIASLAKTISPSKATPSVTLKANSISQKAKQVPEHETTNFCVYDSDGTAVVSTLSLNFHFGSGVMVNGVLLNNVMDDFTTEPGKPNEYGMTQGEANAIQPGKRPLSSMAPTLVLKDKKPWLLLGAPGGSQITTAIYQTLVNRIEYQFPLVQAVALKRVHHQYMPDRIVFDPGFFKSSTKDELGRIGHVLLEQETTAKVTAIEVMPQSVEGVADPKSNGQVRAGSPAAPPI
jgi:gamma-glutamyltranspeptidase/glutathione hydrolase